MIAAPELRRELRPGRALGRFAAVANRAGLAAGGRRRAFRVCHGLKRGMPLPLLTVHRVPKDEWLTGRSSPAWSWAFTVIFKQRRLEWYSTPCSRFSCVFRSRCSA